MFADSVWIASAFSLTMPSVGKSRVGRRKCLRFFSGGEDAVIPRRDPAGHRDDRRHTGRKFRDHKSERVVLALHETRFPARCVERVDGRLLVGRLLDERARDPHAPRTHWLQHLDSRHHLEPPPVVGRATRGANIRLADAAPARCRKSRLFMAERYDQVRHGGEPVFFPKSTRASCHPEGRRPEGSATHGHCRHLGSCLPSHFFLRSTPCTVSCSLA